jgi:hypothetical protein
MCTIQSSECFVVTVVDTSLGGGFAQAPDAWGAAVATWAAANAMDGVVFDHENFGPGFTSWPLSSEGVISWISTCTNAARSQVPAGSLILHSPMAPYFGPLSGGGLNPWLGDSPGYSGVYQGAGWPFLT